MLCSNLRADSINPSLYLVINPEQCRFEKPVDVARKAVAGGVSAIQIRVKESSKQCYQDLVSSITEALRPYHVPVFVNDQIDVAAATGTNCVHLGQNDTPVSEARRILGSEAHIGLTIRSLEEAQKVPHKELSYISIGGVFATQSKNNPEPPIGLAQLSRIYVTLRNLGARCPIIAISGINLQNLESVLATGVDGVAVVSALCQARDPAWMAHQFRNRIDSFNRLNH